MQNLLIQYILNPLCGVMGRFPEKHKDRLFVSGGLLIVVLTFLRHSEAVDYRYLYHFTGCCFGLGLMILASLDKPLRPVRLRRPFLLLPLFGTLLLISGIINNTNYLPEAVMVLAAYPVVFLCWNNADRARIFRLLCAVCKYAVVIFAAASWLLSPIGRAKYPGIFTNTNNASYFLSIGCIGILLDIFYSKKKLLKLLPDLLLFGLAVGLNYYTNSRTGMYALYFALFLGAGLFLLRRERKESLNLLAKLSLCAVSGLVFIMTLIYPWQLRQFIDLPYFDGEEYGVYHATREEILEAADPNWEENLPESGFMDVRGFFHISNIKSDTTGKTLDSYSTGRISIWLAFAEDLNFRGHKTVPPKYIPAYDKEFETAHNTILQYSYESGIGAGLTFLLLNLTSGIATIWYGWKQGREDFAVAPVMFTAAFGMMSMLGSCTASFGYLATLYYYLAQFPVMARLREDKA